VPCYYDRKRRRYAIEQSYFCRAPSLTSQEALGLFLLVYKARNHINIPISDSILKAALKIESNLPNDIKRYCNTVLQNVTIKNKPCAKIDFINKMFFRLIEAILKNRTVLIYHYSSCLHKIIATELDLYHLIYNEHTWYVVGKSCVHKGIRIFKLDEIKELKFLNKYFIRDKQFDIEEHLDGAWSMIPEGRLYNIKLRFRPEVANSVAGIQWHRTQNVKFEKDGSAVLEFRIDGLGEIASWILSYGDQVEVISPDILRNKIVDTAKKILEANHKENDTVLTGADIEL
jgi:predicted DNA-binding transcriptional regulator YafY